jgi:carboxypeptidase C (cathepsin A)
MALALVPGLTRALGAAVLAAALVACGGGGGGADEAPLAPGAVRDTTAYSSAGNASLAAAAENAAVTTRSIALGGATVTYTATAGHLNPRDPRTGVEQASLFYVAYTIASVPPATRPLVFFYNGGPGSASVWLHLGSFAPRRIVTAAPSLAVPLPFQLVDNAESLIDVADLVFVDAVGTGYSQAIAPFTNQTFWGVDADAALMRDFIARYAAVNGRADSPTFLFGESYGTTRSAIVADLMLAAGMRLDGVILLSSILDYNANCAVFAPRELSCEGFLPSYGMTGAWFGLTTPPRSDADAYAEELRAFAATSYRPAVQAYVATRAAAPPGLVDELVARTGAPAALWHANLDLDPTSYRMQVLPGRLMGRYDSRVVADNGSTLARGGDPSATLITAPFAAALQQLLNEELLYLATANYTQLSNAIATWNFGHDGRALPDVVPDLAAALARKPGLRVFSISGHHDLATPFRQTELDLARVGVQPGLFVRAYQGGHMTYLDDASRARLRTDLAAFLGGNAPTVQSSADARRQAADPTRASAAGLPAATQARPAASAMDPGTGTEDRHALAQGGDPWVPPALRVPPLAPSPSGAALERLVRQKIAERDRDVYR